MDLLFISFLLGLNNLSLFLVLIKHNSHFLFELVLHFSNFALILGFHFSNKLLIHKNLWIERLLDSLFFPFELLDPILEQIIICRNLPNFTIFLLSFFGRLCLNIQNIFFQLTGSVGQRNICCFSILLRW